jgi:hypothetical protein
MDGYRPSQGAPLIVEKGWLWYKARAVKATDWVGEGQTSQPPE